MASFGCHRLFCSAAFQSVANVAQSWRLVRLLLPVRLIGKSNLFQIVLTFFQIAVAILRSIIWFILFHVGIDFWLFPNYFIDSNNPLDSFIPFLEVTKRDDMMDLRMLILRIGSVAAIVYGATEFMKEPKSLDDMTSVFSDLSNDVFEWGQNKFLGIPDNS